MNMEKIPMLRICRPLKTRRLVQRSANRTRIVPARRAKNLTALDIACLVAPISGPLSHEYVGEGAIHPPPSKEPAGPVKDRQAASIKQLYDQFRVTPSARWRSWVRASCRRRYPPA